MVAEVETLLPQVKELVDNKTLGSEILTKVERVLKMARKALDGRDAGTVITAADELTKTLGALRGVAARLGKGP
jgi:C4-type Zn-finger protein